MKILFLTRFGRQGASSRMRIMQYLSWFKSADIECVVSPLFDDAMLLRKYQHGGYSLLELISAYWRRICALMGRHDFNLVWIEKEALPWLPAWLERLLLRGKPYVLDFDDAIFHSYDLHRSVLVRCAYGRRIDHLMAEARLMTAGNRYLADRAIAAGARRVEVIPTVVDLARYTSKQIYSVSTTPRIVWIGSPSTVCYLALLHEPLVTLSQQFAFKLRVIGGDVIDLPGVDVEFLPWTEATEVASIQACDIGVMPLWDSPWERGKCGYKLIQYMACGLPVVASTVGVNDEIVHVGENGFLADSVNDWVDSLGKLLSDAVLRQQMGKAGRQLVEATYCIQQIAPRLVSLLRSAGEKR